MALPSISSSDTRPVHLTTFTLKVDGEPLPNSYEIVSIDIRSAAGKIPKASLVLLDGDAAAQDFEVSNASFLIPGKVIEIEGGYSLDETPLFKGIITSQRIQARQRSNSRLYIEARNPAFRMTLERKSSYFTDMPDNELFEDLVNEYGDLTPQVEVTQYSHPEIVQYEVTDWDFLVSRAENLGMVCLARDDEIKIEKPDPSKAAVFKLTYGVNVFALDLELDAQTQVRQVKASSWNYANQEVILSDLEDLPIPQQGNLDSTQLSSVGSADLDLRHSGFLQQQELDAWVEAGMTKSRFARIRGTIQFQGTEAVNPGDLIELKGMSERFNGLAYVSGVRHTLGEGDWETTVEVGLPRTWHYQNYDMSAPPGAGFQPAINGLHIGVVTQLQDDPDGEDRIRVRMPMINSEEPGVWSRVAALDAGDNRGSFFRPEIGDEVLVGFINDDPNDSVILGMLNSSAKPAPLQGSDENHEKGFVTRSEMKLLFNDERPSLVVETPAGNKILLDERDSIVLVEDQNGNSIKLSDNGITMESPSDITLKAGGDLSIEATNISLKAAASAKMEGSAGATLQSSATTIVKGALVQIN